MTTLTLVTLLPQQRLGEVLWSSPGCHSVRLSLGLMNLAASGGDRYDELANVRLSVLCCAS